ncbi:MAG: hypothetical protein QE285_11170 [Aquabacterium sp.]|nr:hypothetical protein [Aquabacterium sp.]
MADGADAVAVDDHIAGIRGAAAAVGDQAAVDEDVVCHGGSLVCVARHNIVGSKPLRKVAPA